MPHPAASHTWSKALWARDRRRREAQQPTPPQVLQGKWGGELDPMVAGFHTKLKLGGKLDQEELPRNQRTRQTKPFSKIQLHAKLEVDYESMTHLGKTNLLLASRLSSGSSVLNNRLCVGTPPRGGVPSEVSNFHSCKAFGAGAERNGEKYFS